MATIDITHRYNNVAYMRGGTGAWANNRTLNPVSRGMIHHTAGWYTKKLGPTATENEEVQEIDRIAADHFNRFGIGPGYFYFAFPSGRLYAVGKWGTHRAHTKGHDPETGKYHNQVGIAICAVGNYEDDKPSTALLGALAAGIHEVEDIAKRKLPWTGHGETPTVGFTQSTACPGRHVQAWLTAYLVGRETPAPTVPKPVGKSDIAAWTEFYNRGAVPVRFDGGDAVYEVRRKVK